MWMTSSVDAEGGNMSDGVSATCMLSAVNVCGIPSINNVAQCFQKHFI